MKNRRFPPPQGYKRDVNMREYVSLLYKTTFYFTYKPHQLRLVPLDYFKTNNVALL